MQIMRSVKQTAVETEINVNKGNHLWLEECFEDSETKRRESTLPLY